MKEGVIPVIVENDKTDFELAIENELGETIESIRDMPIDERRRMIEAKYGSPMRFISLWPFIGRNEPLTLISRQEIEAILDELLK